MKALTIHQPWASLIIEGAKPYEFRSWKPYKSVVGQRIVIHAAARKMIRVDLIAIEKALQEGGVKKVRLQIDAGKGIPVIQRAKDDIGDARFKGRGDLPWGAGLGTAVIGPPIKGTMDAYGWPMLDVEKWETPIPMKGAQGFWNWKGELP